MINGNVIIAFFVMQYVLFFIRLMKRRERNEIIKTNKRLDALRKIAYKSVEEQKEFVKLKYGNKKQSVKFNLKSFLKDNFIAIILFLGPYLFLQYVVKIRPAFFLTLLIAVIVSFIINKILSKYNLQKQEELQTLFR